MNYPTPAAAKQESKVKDNYEMRSVHSDGAVSLYVVSPPMRIYIGPDGSMTRKKL